MLDHEIPSLDHKGLREFGLTTGAICASLFGLILPLVFRHWPPPLWPWITGSVLGIWALFIPGTLNPVYQIWMRIGLVLGWINTRILLGAVFYIIMAPMGLIKRWLGSDAMARQFEPNSSTYRVASSVKPSQSMERPF